MCVFYIILQLTIAPIQTNIVFIVTFKNCLYFIHNLKHTHDRYLLLGKTKVGTRILGNLDTYDIFKLNNFNI